MTLKIHNFVCGKNFTNQTENHLSDHREKVQRNRLRAPARIYLFSKREEYLVYQRTLGLFCSWPAITLTQGLFIQLFALHRPPQLPHLSKSLSPGSSLQCSRHETLACSSRAYLPQLSSSTMNATEVRPNTFKHSDRVCFLLVSLKKLGWKGLLGGHLIQPPA